VKVDREILALAALFYEIGRFKRRACNDSQSFTTVRDQWLKDQGKIPALIINILGVQGALIEEAAKLSAGLKENEDLPSEPPPQQALQRPLISVFSKVSLSREQEPRREYSDCWAYYLPRAMSDQCNHPQGAVKMDKNKNKKLLLTAEDLSKIKEGYKKLWEGFEKDFRLIRQYLHANNALSLLEKYTSFIPHIPAERVDDPHSDISLFDQMKTTSAIASCLYVSLEEEEGFKKDNIKDREEKRYLMVGGDFSGVQRFIYTISSKGALRGLRARSFFLELLTEHVIYEILNPLRLSRANIIYAGGSRFSMLLPNTPITKKRLERVRQEINAYFRRALDARLYLALDWIELSGKDLCELGRREEEREKELARKIEAMKRQKFLDDLTDLRGAKAFLNPKEQIAQKDRQIGRFSRGEEWGECDVCYRYDRLRPLPQRPKPLREVKACPLCEALYHWGGKLGRARYVSRSRKKPADGEKAIQIGPVYYHILDEREADAINNRSPTWVILSRPDDWRPWKNKRTYPILLANYISQESIDFDGLAKGSIGAHRIGILRMDVDRLGDIFIQGLRPEENTLTRHAALSRLLTYFFKFHMNAFCIGEGINKHRLLRKRKRIREVAIVYSGGDDLFIVGAWSDIAELAFDIRNAFKEYTCNSPDINLSGGMAVSHPHYPLYQMAELGVEAEKKAKANLDPNGRKDSVALFYKSDIFDDDERKHVLKWEDIEKPVTAGGLWGLMEELVNTLGDGLDREGNALALKPIFSRAFIYNLFEVVKTRREKGKLYLPQLIEALRRGGAGIEGRGKRTSKKERNTYKQFQHLKLKLLDINTIKYLHPALIWLDLLVRREEKVGRRERRAR
jgi:CRISPR-associated protein Csm1